MSDEDREFFGREYDRLGAELVANETMGDARVSGFLAVWAAAAGGVAVVVTSNDAKHRELLNAMAVAGLVTILLNGVVVLARIVKRNLHTDTLADTLMRLRSLLVGGSSGLVPVTLPWSAEPKPKRPALLHFGILHVIYAANATAAGLLGVVLQLRDPAMLAMLVAGVFLAQVLAVGEANRRGADDRFKRNKKFTDARAGQVVSVDAARR